MISLKILNCQLKHVVFFVKRCKKTRKFIFEEFPLANKLKIENDDSILENGIVDSMGILEIVTFMEKEFQILVSDEELLPENFSSISNIVAFIESKEISK